MSYLPIIVAGLIPMALGMIWYSDALFGKAWRDSIGMTKEQEAGGNMGLRMGLAAFLSIVLAFILKGLQFASHGGAEKMAEAGDMNFGHGAFHGLLIGAMLAMPVLVNNGLFEQKSTKNLLINAGYWILAITLMTGLLNAWDIPA